MNTIKIGIIGLGRIGKIHLENLCTKWEGVQVVAAMNPSSAGQSFAHRFKVPLVTSDADEVIGHPEIDAIVICSPTTSHSDYVLKAAKAGKAIFCEKPMDLSLDRVRKTLKTVNDCNVPLMMAFNQRLDPNFAAVKDHITKWPDWSNAYYAHH